jgi:hypothetical protein
VLWLVTSCSICLAETFKNTTTNEKIEISHKEKAWIENKDQKKIIDYKYSFDLNGVKE